MKTRATKLNSSVRVEAGKPDCQGPVGTVSSHAVSVGKQMGSQQECCLLL